MKIKALRLALACAALFPFIPAELRAGAPLKISFQGRLDESGVPAVGAKTFVFKLYDALSGGTLVWTGDSQPVALVNGVFSAILAAGAPTLSTAAFAGARYLEITVDGVPLSPRQEMVSAPYALVAQALAPDAVIPAAPIADGSITDAKALLSTAAISSGRFGDDRVLITTGAFTGGFNGNDQLVRLDGSGKLPVSTLPEGDPVFVLSVSSLIVQGDINNWDAAYGWGNHAAAGYETVAAHSADLANYAARAATQAFTGANTFTSSAAFTFQHASAPAVRVSSGLVVAAGNVGLGTASPNSTLSVGGSMSLPIKRVTSADHPYLVSDADYTIVADATDGDITVTLPAAASVTGRVYIVKRVDSLDVNAVTLDAAGGLVEGSVSQYMNSLQGESIIVQSDGTDWHVLSWYWQ